MNDGHNTMKKAHTHDLKRRVVLGGLLGAYAASLIPWALAQPVSSPDQGAFLGLSAILAGRQTLDGAQAKRLYDALVADDPGFPAAAQALLKLINDRKIDPANLHQLLTDEKSALAPVAQNIARAWFMGIVGSGDKARALAYETALNAEIVQDQLKPPTFAYGAYGSWAKKPG
ncbi:Membrane bound FAD containing D-sorbitol dehydrogenase [Polaromonas sp. OV174]|uniref:sorbitol dehydrogenase family protein n=1 Tax=Polaromonas sp. OV174 TaxID=1855300 RepID=UPI0008E15F8D|nr:sorbitol dehydrogenase family protein [Polaromonas sp. OV174]SFC28292.1 Membrane bound FAD containing D-sorbitol dehydrogenase [Polaromonas sp. OV174]